MADTKITALAVITTVDPANDVLPIVDVSNNSMAASGTTCRVTTNQLLGAGGTATLASATISGDLTVDTSTLKVDSANNRVGIGTATPGTACDVASGTVRVKNAVGDTSGLLIYQDTGDASKIFNYYNGSMQFGINNTTAMTLNATGLGVGDAPAANTRLTLGSVNPTGLNLAFKTTGVTTGRVQTYLGNTSGDLLSGIEGSTAGQTLTGSAAYSGFIGTITNNPFYLVSNGLIRATIDSSGNVGIGVAPSAWGSGFRYVQAGPGCAYGTNGSVDRTDVAANWYYNGGDKYINATGKASVFQQSGGAFFWLSTNTASGGAGSAMTLNTAMTLDASGNLLVGTPTNTNVSRIFSRGTATSSALALQGASGDVALAQLTVGKFDNNTTTSQIFVRFTINDNSGGSGQINANGASQAAFGTFSDSRLKENIVSLPSQLANILSLRPVEFDYKDGSGHQIGFVAQEMQEVYSDAVGEQNGFLTVTGWSKTEARLVSAIKELAAKVQALEAKLA